MYSLASVVHTDLVLCGRFFLPPSAVDLDLTIRRIDDIRISFETAARGILDNLPAMHTSRWLILLAALTLGLTGLNMVLCSVRRARAQCDPTVKKPEPQPDRFSVAEMAADVAGREDGEG